MDRINIKNLEIFAHHGVFPEEKENGQLYYLSAALYTDLSAAGKTDDLKKTIDYGKICHDIKNYVTGNLFDLIETVAEGLAAKLLIENHAIDKIWLEIKKPSAPIGLPLETVSVEIERGWHTAYIALGSNLGDRHDHIDAAVREIRRIKGCRHIRVSSFIIPPPYGNVEQGDFLNGCLKLDTILPPIELLDVLQGIENDEGRIRDVHWGPRTLDLDILMYDDLIIKSERLILPHEEMHKREFVLKPLSEIAPYLVHPIYKKTILELLESLNN